MPEYVINEEGGVGDVDYSVAVEVGIGYLLFEHQGLDEHGGITDVDHTVAVDVAGLRVIVRRCGDACEQGPLDGSATHHIGFPGNEAHPRGVQSLWDS